MSPDIFAALWRERRFITSVLRRFGVPEYDAQDLAIDIIVHVLRVAERGQLNALRAPRSFLFAVARRQAARWHNARAREVLTDDLGHVPSGAPSAEATMAAKVALGRVLAQLTREERSVLLLIAEGRDAGEAARMLRVPIGTVHSRLRRARRRFKK